MIFYLAVEPRRGRLDVHVLDAAVEDVPVEGGLELRTDVGLDHLDPEGHFSIRGETASGWRWRWMTEWLRWTPRAWIRPGLPTTTAR